MQKHRKPYKYCVVPMCENNNKTAPGKVYFIVPKNEDMRKKWCRAIKRDNVSSLSHLYCCEDHFNIEEDTENYMRFRIMAEHGQKVTLQLKKGVVPHVFHCQKDQLHLPPEIKGAMKRKRQEPVEEPLTAAALTKADLPKAGPSKVLDTYINSKKNKMEKLPMCRLCLAENVRMYVVVNKDLHELYERLTDKPFVTGDSRPILACFICCSKLKQCCQLQRKCLEAEELLTQMINQDCELNQDHFRCFNGLIVSPMEHVSIESDDEYQTECDAIKEELPAVCERLDDVIEPKEEHQSDELELENVYDSYSFAEDIPAQQSEPDSEDYEPLIRIKMEVEEEQEELRKEPRASDTTRSSVAEEQKLYKHGKNLEDVIINNQKKNEESVTKVTQNTQNCPSRLIPKSKEPFTNTTSRVNISVIYTSLGTNCLNDVKKLNSMKHIQVDTGERPFKCDICQSCFSRKEVLTQHIRTHTSAKPYKCEKCQLCFSQKIYLSKHIRTHTDKKPFKCEECQLCFRQKNNLTRHIRFIHSHTGEKPYKCEECLRWFSQKGGLRQHVLTHTGEKLYECNECQRCFSQKIQLIHHIRTHTGEKPFKCEECQRCFSQKSSVTRHIRTHSKYAHGCRKTQPTKKKKAT